ncbi:ATP-grasp domain-containing protein [Streptomyces pactum]|uniref:ATP-grasp domain-containing protein n=1 Tax=Streptomyces pactum TaxID=68249 RepID=UPI003701A868
MRVGLITAEPGHPLLAAATSLLRAAGHRVEAVDPSAARDATAEPADVYLLKSRTPDALALARALERLGAPVVNSAAATARCQDRTAMAERAAAAGLPFAATRTFATLSGLARDSRTAGPVVVKSRHSRRHDLVARADDGARLRELAAAWPEEPVVVQDFAPNDGWDHKLWAIGDRVFAALRRSELSPGGRGPTRPLDPESLPPGRTALVRRVGEVFTLDVYGVDIVETTGGTPLIVDINAFPGVRGQRDAPAALVDLTLRAAARRLCRPGRSGAGGTAP